MAGIYPPITLAVNKFLGALTNLIAYSQIADTTKGGEMLRLVASCQDLSVENGDGKVVRSADLLSVTDLPTTSTILTSVPPTVYDQYIPVTNFKVVQMTINQYLQRGAFLSEDAASGFIAYLLSIMQATKQAYLYQLLVGMYENYTPTLPTQTVTINLYDVSTITDPAQRQAALTYNSNAMYQKLLLVLKAMAAPTAKFNDLGLTEIIDYKDLKFVVNSHFDTQMMVNTLATLLNSDKITAAQKWSETIEIPDDQFTNPDTRTKTIGWLGHLAKIQFGYFYQVATSFFDPSTLNQNNWLHFSYYMDEVDAYPMVKFEAAYSATPAIN